jgi:trehalose 6-phosphate phosphatase
MAGEDITRELLRAWSETSDSAAVFTDIDGTLAPIVPTPDMAEVPKQIKDLLRRLSEKYLLVAGISGRKTEDALDLVGLSRMSCTSATTGSRSCVTVR